LLGEEFGADGDFGLRGFVAGSEETREAEEVDKVENAAHVRRKCSSEKKEFSTQVAQRTGGRRGVQSEKVGLNRLLRSH
jgi:hypothetical protein